MDDQSKILVKKFDNPPRGKYKGWHVWCPACQTWISANGHAGAVAYAFGPLLTHVKSYRVTG